MSTRNPLARPAVAAALTLLSALPLGAEVILQYFEADWDEIYRRLPEIAEIGYDGLWVPSPCKSPIAGTITWGNVGYNLYDRFDLGDIPQRGTLRTRYGTRGDLRNLVDNLHRCAVKIYPDTVFNHNGNGPDYRTYPGMKPNDFHVWQNDSEPGGWRRAPRMSNYDDINNGYGRTFQEELVSLIDIVTENDGRFQGANYPYYASDPTPFVRHPGDYQKYPFHDPPTNLPAENVRQMLVRWINWLGYAMDYDGLRLDAAKHVVHEFFGTAGQFDGFNHNAQWNFDQRRGYSDANEYDQMYQNYILRDDALLFAEIFSGSSATFDYWRNGGVKMRFLDFPFKINIIGEAFNNGNLSALGWLGVALDPTEGVTFVQSHDQGGPSKLDLAYAYLLTHVGLPVVYFSGNNISWDDYNTRTWVLPGHGGALGDYDNNRIPNLVYIHNHFARGKEYTRWSDGDFFCFERYEDDGDDTPEAGEGLLLVALNDSGYDISHEVQTAFEDGTWLHDYTGNNPNDIQVYGGGKAYVTVPGMGGQGYVCYAPHNATADGDPLRFNRDTAGTPYGTMNWLVPGGVHATNKPRQVVRITGDTVYIDVHFNEPAYGTVDNVMIKWGEGADLNPSATNYGGNDIISSGFEQATEIATGHWRLQATLTNLSDGVYLVRARCFNQRPAGYPAVFQTFSEVVYLDRSGPELDIVHPAEGETIQGDAVAVISNTDFTAWYVEVQLDGGSWQAADEIMRGCWKYPLSDLAAGSHTMVVRALERDLGDTTNIINTSVWTRVFNVDTNGPAVSISHTNGTVITMPFFSTTISVPAGLDQSSVKLYWDGYEMAGLSGTGTLTHVFDGRYVSGGVEDRLWGAFCNGPHYFRAVAVQGGETNTAVVRVYFNLYGSNEVDSDGDGLPDDVEMPGFSNGAPGPNVPWPGDNNQDMIPNDGETWTRLNPMNADTTYDGVWDGDEDWDGDGYPNLCEVRQGYLLHDDPYYFDIYDASSHPDDCGSTYLPPQTSWDPENPNRCPGSTLTITYAPNQGPLSNTSPVYIHIGYNNWSDVSDPVMSDIGNGQWQYVYDIPTNATDVEFVFHDASSNIWDNNSGNNWTAAVSACVVITNYFVMDGQFDSTNYVVYASNMYIYAAVKGQHLYVATWSANGGANDHFLYVTDQFDEEHPTPWAKAGYVWFDTGTKPHLVAESQPADGYHAFYNSGNNGRSAMGPGGAALEGELDLVEVFGYMPDIVYLAAVAYGDNDGDGIASQGPPAWNADNDIQIMEFLPVPVESVRDEDLDGNFDCGNPRMWTVVGGHTNDANYGLRRIILDEALGESVALTVIFEPGVSGTNVVSNVELFSNLNRRDFATLDEDPDTVTTDSRTTYYRAYPMTNVAPGRYAYTLRVRKCGAYRINARYKVNGGPYIYYADGGLRRACAVVVSPRKVLDLVMYEVNVLNVEATNDTFYGRSTFEDLYLANTDRPDYLNTNHYPAIGVNTIWLQPIHPIGYEGRETDPDTGQPYDPGSPYAVRDYWKVNPILGDPATEEQAMKEFTNFVARMDDINVNVMLDATFNHSAWDCVIGEVGVELFSWATNANDLIRDIRPQWYSRKGNYGEHASYYNSSADNDIAVAPDRYDFGKWNDVADFFFGRYDALVQGQSGGWRDYYLMERDHFEGHDTYTREIWEYFARYPLYWLEKTGHPAGTPKGESFRGIDGLRCDFAQGLPSEFWEYVINRTRSVKWDFIFMAESLDGYREVAGSKRHGIGYRSARQFDILNENMIFYWRDSFFSYPYQGPGGANDPPNPQPYTYPTWQAFDNRRNAYDVIPLLLDLSCHDEVYPSDDPYRTLYAYAELAAMDGVPMLFYGQEAGALNNSDVYTNVPNHDHNFDHYELNFGKSIPHFKRYNCMSNVWAHRDWNLQQIYGRINNARLDSRALRSRENYFLSRTDTAAYDPDIFAVAKYEAPGVSAASQEVVFVFVNNDFSASTNRWATFNLDVDYNGRNWFGIIPTHEYNIVDLISTNPSAWVWQTNKTGSELINNGITVGLTGNPYDGAQAQYLKLVDRTETAADNDGDGITDFSDPDDDNDGLPDSWETAHGLDPFSGAGDDGPEGDPDHDGMDNRAEFAAWTDPTNAASCLRLSIDLLSPDQVQVRWSAVADQNYHLETADESLSDGTTWNRIYFGTALSNQESAVDYIPTGVVSRFYRIRITP